MRRLYTAVVEQVSKAIENLLKGQNVRNLMAEREYDSEADS
jgi:hypothetical protein